MLQLKISKPDAITIALRAEADKARKASAKRVEVTYEAIYAIYVHEDLTKNHPNGQAKFLETAAKEKGALVAETISNSIRGLEDLELALLKGGYKLLEESNKLVPIDTGFLKSTGVVNIV